MGILAKIILGGVVVIGVTFTTTVSTFAAIAGTTTSKSDITFTTDDGTTPTTPTDPTNPGTEVTPTDPDKPVPTTGPLRIDYISNIHFGVQMMSGSDITYKAKYDEVLISGGAKKYVPTYVQVTDNRGSNTGWKLQVSNDQFAAGTNELTGAVLTFKDARLNSTNLAKPDNVEAVVLTGNGMNQEVINAPEDTGMGVWTNAFGTVTGQDETSENASVTLKIPGITKKVANSQYVTTLTWTLTDTPD
ncbi:WxL domain-containing protein [Listeria grandensis]|uniref:WxL domain-containing protein n=1 Tax=Listeria grandensis TaxID=1494963 RepID=A0A7X0Y4U5_9LIST|nr:WxL domain-containing protein [Listeria grandensis]MBC1475216.1 WxL domain-containing protein [Listeria grandensis]MBC1937051.1 WxL domain-containing protein [Listeria grandensis]